jgi:hypothetical protein
MLEEALEELQAGAEERAKEPRRWQVQTDLIQVRLELQIVQLLEYQSALGAMRKELQPLDPKMHTGWRLVPRSKISGDAAGKRMAKEASRQLEQIIRDHAGTPYEVLARRLKETPVGLEWEPEKR